MDYATYLIMVNTLRGDIFSKTKSGMFKSEFIVKIEREINDLLLRNIQELVKVASNV